MYGNSLHSWNGAHDERHVPTLWSAHSKLHTSCEKLGLEHAKTPPVRMQPHNRARRASVASSRW